MAETMTAKERREAILRELERAESPVSASALAKQFHVSRQAVVGDVAMLRALNAPIAATPRGYVLTRAEGRGKTFTIACRHGRDRLGEELYAVVDNGGALLDVVVEHAPPPRPAGPRRCQRRHRAPLRAGRARVGTQS